jgi:propionyl-CoA synthetase
MLACARIGAIHSVVFGGFASVSLASRIEDFTPSVVVSADAGSRAGKVLAYKPLLDEAIRLSRHKPASVLLVDRGLAPMEKTPGRDHDWGELAQRHTGAQVPCVWLDATDISYTIYTSGTTGRPKGVQRDVGGYAVALAASMKHIFLGEPGETYFSTSDIGWVVGHSYIVYGPLIAGMASIMYEGQKQDPAFLKKYDLSSLKALFLAGEPLDEPTARWISDGLGVPIIDNYWQTESGWPMITIANGVERQASKFGSPGVPMYGYDIRIVHESTGEELTEPNQKGVVVVAGPTPPGFMQTVWGDDERFVSTYWSSIPGQQVYSTFDWGIRDKDGYFYILGRTDDVINVAGHRLGTREIEESISSHPNVAEVAVVGVADPLKGQVAMAFVVIRDTTSVSDEAARLKLEGDIMKVVDDQLGAVARPSRVRFVTLLPKTRSGKLLRRAIQAVCEGRDAGDLTTIEDPSALQQIKDLLTQPS